jgi:hypothetical protein
MRTAISLVATFMIFSFTSAGFASETVPAQKPDFRPIFDHSELKVEKKTEKKLAKITAKRKKERKNSEEILLKELGVRDPNAEWLEKELLQN